jgi:hypothetical protein
MASWQKPLPVLTAERPSLFVKRESMWDLQKRLVQNRATIINPEMDPTVGPMLKDLSGNIIIYDYFIRGGFFYLISTYWSDNSPKLVVKVNDLPVSEYGYQEYMSTRYFVCPMQDTGLVWVTINGVSYELMPDIIKSRGSQHKLGIVLNFKYETAAWIRRFLDYYRGQGVGAFYFYYNGPVLPDNLPTGNDIKYKVWDCPFKIFNNRFIHSAQTTAYCSFRWRYYDDCEWVAAIDFDEFICDITEKGRLVDVLSKMDCGVVMINNYWSSVGSEGGLIKYSTKSCGFGFDNGRTKCIFNTKKYRGEWGIHLPKGNCMMIKSKRLIFFHIIDCLHPERTELLIEPIKKTKHLSLAKL